MDEQRDLFSEAPPAEPAPVQDERTEAETAAAAAEDIGGHGRLKRLVDDNFLQYASYVIRDRAIPDLDDGLKPVHRRILHSLFENDDGKFIKVANIVGYCMQYHPHGDASIADALVTLTNKDYLIEGQGNFGNLLTGDPAAASRYIECRLTPLAREELFNPECTRFVPSYDGRRKEPVTLPAKLPLLLLLGAEGIAVGLSTRILPHNFCELLEAEIAVLKKKKFELFPDFKQGGLMDAAEYDGGLGSVRVRARIEQRDEKTLVVRELPYGVTTESLMASVEDAARKKKIHIRSISDFTAGHVEIEIKLGSQQNPEKALQTLYAFTQCEMSHASRIVVIHKRRPVEMDVNEVIKHNAHSLVDLLEKELKLNRDQLLDEFHRKTLVQIFVEHRIYKRIEECTSYEAVKQEVFDGVNEHRDRLKRDITQQDVEMLLSIPIKRISRFDMDKSRSDIEKIMKDLKEVEKNLAAVTPYTIRYLQSLLRKYKDEYPRRTELTSFKKVEIKKLTRKELTLNYDRERGYIGTDIEGEAIAECTNHDRVVIVWNDGRYKVVKPPEKLFVDEDVLYCAKAERDKTVTMVYTDEDGITYIKRFTFGGAILDKEYLCVPTDKATILLFDDDNPDSLFVKYKKEKRLRILQQEFHAKDIPVKGVKAKGAQMTVKTVRSIAVKKPRNWDSSGPKGAVIDF